MIKLWAEGLAPTPRKIENRNGRPLAICQELQAHCMEEMNTEILSVGAAPCERKFGERLEMLRGNQAILCGYNSAATLRPLSDSSRKRYRIKMLPERTNKPDQAHERRIEARCDVFNVISNCAVGMAVLNVSDEMPQGDILPEFIFNFDATSNNLFKKLEKTGQPVFGTLGSRAHLKNFGQSVKRAPVANPLKTRGIKEMYVTNGDGKLSVAIHYIKERRATSTTFKKFSEAPYPSYCVVTPCPPPLKSRATATQLEATQLEATQIEGGEDDSGDEIFVGGIEVGDPLHLARQISDTDIIFMILRDIVGHKRPAINSKISPFHSRLHQFNFSTRVASDVHFWSFR